MFLMHAFHDPLPALRRVANLMPASLPIGATNLRSVRVEKGWSIHDLPRFADGIRKRFARLNKESAGMIPTGMWVCLLPLRQWNSLPEALPLELLNLHRLPDADYQRLAARLAESATTLSEREILALCAAMISRGLQMLVDDWLQTGMDAHGGEFHKRNWHRGDVAPAYLEQYIARHPGAALSLILPYPRVVSQWNGLCRPTRTVSIGPGFPFKRSMKPHAFLF